MKSEAVAKHRAAILRPLLELEKRATQLVVLLVTRHGSWVFPKAILGSFTGVSKRMMRDPLRYSRVVVDPSSEKGVLLGMWSASSAPPLAATIWFENVQVFCAFGVRYAQSAMQRASSLRHVEQLSGGLMRWTSVRSSQSDMVRTKLDNCSQRVLANSTFPTHSTLCKSIIPRPMYFWSITSIDSLLRDRIGGY